MDLSLSSSLVGSATLNPDKLSLDLQFATDKTLVARKGPTPTFTRASTATFVGSDGLIQSAAINAARFDHDPITLACRGLLIEESRTNLLVQSEDLGTTWSTDGGKVAVSTNVIASPSGATNADKITENSTILERKILIGGVTAVASTVYTYSCYLKAAERDVAQLAFGGTFGNQFQNFIIGGVNAGTLGSGSGVTSPQITALPNGWYRCTATVTSAGSGATQVTIGPSDSSTLTRWGTYIGTVGSGIYAWGAQLEAGAFPTSYIPTTTASVVRSADVCSITGSAFTGFYNQSEGTLFAQTTKVSTNANSFIVAANNNTFNEEIDLRYSAVTLASALVNVANVSQLTGLQATVTSGSSVKQTLGYRLNDCAYSANGATVITDTSALIPTVSRLNIGNSHTTGQSLNGHIASIRYFKKRLANAKLQAITA